MWNFDFLKNINNGYNTVKSTIEQYFPSQTLNFRMDKSPKAPVLAIPQPAVPVAEAAPVRPTAEDYLAGFSKFGAGNPPIATQSAQLAQAATRLPDNIDPFLPAVIALMESQGGLRQAGLNNAYGIYGTQDGSRQFINYPDPQTALLGGNGLGYDQRGFIGNLLDSGYYRDFLNSGNIADYFRVATPPGPNNPTPQELITRYEALRALFPEF